MIASAPNRSMCKSGASLINESILEIMLLGIFALMPFSTVVNGILFNNASLFGVSAFNVILLLVLVFCVLEKVLQPHAAKRLALLSACLVVVFVILLKVLLQGGAGSFEAWLQQYQYYLFVPLMLFVMFNAKLPADRFLNVIIMMSIPECLVSFYSFFTSDYFGLVSHQTMAQYAIVGTSFSRMMGTFGSPNVAGSYYAIVLAAIILASKVTSSNGARKMSPVKIGQAACLLVCLVLTFSRMALIGFVFAMILFAVELSRKSGRMRVSGVLSAFAIALAVIAFIGWMADNGMYFWTSGDFVNNPRLEKWADFLASYDQWFILGAPFGSHIVSGTTTLSDNSFLLLIGSIGFVPALVYYALLAAPIASICRVERYLRPYVLMILIFMILSDFVSLYPSAYIAVPLICFFASTEESEHESANYNSILPISTTHKRRSPYSF